MKNKVVTLEQAVAPFQDGQTVLFADWHGEISAEEIITGIIEKNVKNITAVGVSGGMPDQGCGRLIANHQVSKLLTTHIGLNPVAKEQYVAGELEIEFIPQGTFTERIRCGGFGLGGCLTPTGVGTAVAEGKQVLNLNGKDYLLEMPIRGDITLIKAAKGDSAGNIKFDGTSGAISNIMAFASDLCIVEVEELVEVGELGPEEIDVPAPVVDMIYVRQGEKKPFCPMWKRAKAKAEAAAAAKA
ncbi:MAG: CoA transferase subunit A [Oscillospiraceae bacterium]|nr:CoA transferase subunit A [Oscillospiraceae bacterium]